MVNDIIIDNLKGRNRIMHHENWVCLKCKHTEYELSDIRVAGSFWPKIFNIQNKK